MWKDKLPGLESRIEVAIQKALKYLKEQQLKNGSWAPLWFGNQHNKDEVNYVSVLQSTLTLTDMKSMVSILDDIDIRFMPFFS